MKASSLAVALALSAAPFSTALAAPKPTIVLVHGAWETSGVLAQVAQKLTLDGYVVRSVNLPGRPGNPLPIQEVSFEGYRAAVAAVIDHEKAPVVLIGHSYAGFVISAAAEAEPARIKTLVYVAAYRPVDGQSLLSLATTDKDAKVGEALVIDKDHGIAQIKYEARADLFANDAPAAVGDVVAKSIVDEPLAPLATPVRLTGKFAGVDKVYIHTARDHVVSPSLQTRMVAQTPVRLELSVDTGHIPFITRPDALVAAIEKAID